MQESIHSPMETGNSTLLITPENVHECLSKLIEVSPQRLPNSLHYLLLVDFYLALNTHLPPTPQRRYDALNHILSSFVTDQYRHHRTTLNLTEVSEKNLDQQQAVTFIAEEGLLASVELLSWSWLYYHFVRVDLDIAYSTFCNYAHIDKRTLRRYQRHGIQRLTDYLSKKEGEARKEQRQRWMYTQLPGSVFTLFVARDELVKRAIFLLETASPAHIQISGPSGIGKSTLAGIIAKHQIDAGLVDRFIWINHPNSIEYVGQYLAEQLFPEYSAISLREYALLQRLLIVVDDIEVSKGTARLLMALLDELSSAHVLLTSRVYIELTRAIHIPMKELSKGAVFTILKSFYLKESDQELLEGRVSHIWESAGGNPGAAILLLHHWPFTTTLPPTALHNPLHQAYATLDSELKRAWLSFVLLPPRSYDLKSIIHFWATEINEVQLQYLLRHHMLEVFEEDAKIKCGLSTLGRHFIESQYSSDEEMQQTLGELLNILGMHPQSNSSFMFDVIEHILLSDWLQLDNHIREEWIERFCEDGLQKDHAAQWAAILKPYSQIHQPHQFRLRVNYAVCLRRVSQWKQAEALFDQVSRSAGRVGQFLDQAYALLEWAILVRQQGKYEKALELLSHVEVILSKHKDENLLYALRLEQTQIALDAGEVDRVEGLIQSLPETPHTLMLWCELLLLKRDYHLLHRTFSKIESILQERPGDFARMQVIIGQSYQQMLDFTNAYRHLYAALTIVEEKGDIFATARIRANLGAVMIEQGAYRDAQLTLEYAENIQRQLRDQVGLAVTRHNIKLLKRKVVS